MNRTWLVLVLLFVVSLPAVTTRLYAADEIEYFAYLRSVWFDRDVSFDNEYRYFYDRGIARAFRFHETFLEMTTETGHRLNFGTIGSALLWAPMYGVADVGVRIAGAAGSAVEADGFSRPYLAAIAYGSAFYGFLAVLLSAFVARRVAGPGELPAVLVWIGTPLLFYMYVSPGMSHACSAFAVAAFVAAWLVVRERWSVRGMAALGALAALMTMVREQDAFFAIGPAIDLTWTVADDLRSNRGGIAKRFEGALAGAAAFAVCFVPQAWAYFVLNGRVGPATSVAAKMRWSSPHALQVLFSPEHGFFWWTPLALLGVVGLVVLIVAPATEPALRYDRRRLGICLLAMFIAQVYVSGSVDSWSVAGSFGQRRFVGTTVVFVAGLAVLLQRAQGWRRGVLVTLLAIGVWWNLGLMAQFGAGLMDRQRLEPGRNAYNTFVAVPRGMPDLVYRYLFNRSSFYRPPAS